MTSNENLLSPEELEKELNLDDIRTKMESTGLQRDIAFQGCSAVTGDGIWEGIGRLQEIMENYSKNAPSKDNMSQSNIKNLSNQS